GGGRLRDRGHRPQGQRGHRGPAAALLPARGLHGLTGRTAGADMHEARLNRAQVTAGVVLRVLIGWHVLYEGVSKIANPAWSAAGYLGQSRGPLASLFRWMASDPNVLANVDFLNRWGLTAIGLGLVLGCFTRAAAASGMLVLLLFYLCNPPFVGYYYSVPTEGSYLIVNKNLVEIAALAVVLVTGSGRAAGLDRVIHSVLRGRRPVWALIRRRTAPAGER